MKKIRKLNCNQEMTPIDKSFLEDAEQVIVDDYGAPVELDKLLVVKNNDTNAVGLFMPTDTAPQPPDGYSVIGTVMPKEEDNISESMLEGDGTETEGFLDEESPMDDVPMPDAPAESSKPEPGADDKESRKKSVMDMLRAKGNDKKPAVEDEYNPWADA